VGHQEVGALMGDRRFKVTSIAILVVLAAIWLLPIYAMLNTSLKTQTEVAAQKYLQLPQRIMFKNYVQAFRALRVGLANSAIITLPATFLCVFFGSLAGYYLTMFEFKQSQLVFFWIVVATFLPYQIVLIPITTLIGTLNLMNTYAGLILIYVILNIPMGTLITATFFMKMPIALQEAAALDGCKPLMFYRRILVPVSIPGLISAAILVFVQIYNEFLLAIALTRGPKVKPVMPILAELKGSQIAQWHIQMAGAVIVSVLPLLIFVVLSEYFISGLMAGYSKE
jgi:glucose/mannose transport system permease protein